MARWFRAFVWCWSRSATEEEQPFCSFCATPQSDVRKLVQGAAKSAFICDECGAVVTDILASEDRAWAEERVEALRHRLADTAERSRQTPGACAVAAAARVIHESGRRHRWPGFDKPYDELDPIGRSEFEEIVERALAAADAARARRPQDKPSSRPNS
jgi:hypothetical protein